MATLIPQGMQPDNADVTWRIYYSPNRFAQGTSPGGGLRVQTTTGDAISYLVQDHLNSTSLTLNTSGSITGEMVYSAWKGTRFAFGATPTDRLYTGQYEAEAGLYFYNARWYDNQLGRFAQADSIIPEPRNPMTWDRYAYVNNNPVIYNDPSGHANECGYLSNSHCGVGAGPILPVANVYDFDSQEHLDNTWQATETAMTIIPVIGNVFDAVITVRDMAAGETSLIGGGTALALSFIIPGMTANEAALLDLVPNSLENNIISIVETTGQKHHILSNQIMNALNEHETLMGVFRRNDFLVQALNKESHLGYQKWQIVYDLEVVEWLNKHSNATPIEFMTYLKNVYNKLDSRFPDAWHHIQMATEDLR